MVTRGAAQPLIPAARSQSDSDRRIKMLIPACVLLAILSLPFSLCGMWRWMELEPCPPRVEYSNDHLILPAERRQPGSASRAPLPRRGRTTFDVFQRASSSSRQSFSKQPEGHKRSHRWSNCVENGSSLPVVRLLPAGRWRSAPPCSPGGAAAG